MASNIATASGLAQDQGQSEDPSLHFTKLFVKFLQLVYGTFEKGNYRWSMDPDTTEVLITGESPINREAIEKNPSIVVSRGPYNYGNLAMDQFAGPHFKKDASGQKVLVPNLDHATGRRRHTDLVGGSISFNCLSMEGLEAGRLAHICAMAVRRLKRTLMKAGLHRVGEDVSVSAESPPGAIVSGDSNGGVVMVTVSLPFFFQDFWSVEPADKKLLTQLDMALTSNLNFPAPGAVPIKEPGINGKTLTYSRLVSLNTRTGIGTLKTPKPRK